MKVNDFFDNLNAYFDEQAEDVEDLEDNTQIYSYAYKNEDGEVYEIRIFNPSYRELLSIDREGKITIVGLD